MQLKFCVVAFLAVHVVPAFALVEISNCSTNAKIGCINQMVCKDNNSMYQKMGEYMLPYAKHVIDIIAKGKNKENVTTVPSPKTVQIGAIVSNTDNGLGVLELIRMLKTDGYTNIKIVVVRCTTENPILPDWELEKKITDLRSEEVLWFHILEKNFGSHNSLTSGQIIEKMQNVEFLVDGLCGAEYGADNANDTLKDAFKILTGLSPADKTKSVFVMSHVTPSGRTESGEWENKTAFHCSAVVTTTYALPALKGDIVKNILAHPQINADNDVKAAFLSALAANSLYGNDIAAIKEELKKVVYPGWLELKSKN